MERKTMTVAKMIAELQKLPGDATIEYYGYAMGKSFYEPLEPSKMVYHKGRNCLVLLADWN